MRFIAAIVASVLLAWTSYAGTITVCPSGCQYSSIQDAIDAAPDGEVTTIEIGAGTYNEYGLTIDYTTKTVNLSGVLNANGTPASIIDGDWPFESILIMHGPADDSVVIENLELTRGGSLNQLDELPVNGAGMNLNASCSPTIRNCVFNNNQANNGAGGGIYCMHNSDPTIIHCTFVNNQATLFGFSGHGKVHEPKAGSGGGIYCKGSNPIVEDCLFDKNKAAEAGGGILATNQALPTITSCSFENCTAGASGGAILMYQNSNATIMDCSFDKNGTTSTGGAVTVSNQCWAQILNCTFTENDSSGAIFDNWNPFTEMFHMCERGGGAVWVGQVYCTALFSWADEGPSNATITDCVFDSNTTNIEGGAIKVKASTATISDCQIKNNSTVEASGDQLKPYGGGLYFTNSAICTVSNCDIINNSALERGGGVSLHDCSPTFTDCLISGNSASTDGGGFYLYHSYPTLNNCVIRDNTASDDGGGMHLDHSSPVCSRCVISNNSAVHHGGGIWGSIESEPTLNDTSVCGNTAEGSTTESYSQIDCSYHQGGDTCVDSGCYLCTKRILVGPNDWDDFNNIQDGINAAETGDMLIISQGTYPLSSTIQLGNNGISLKGNVDADGAPATIIDGGDSCALMYQTGSISGSGFVMENLVLQNGRSESHSGPQAPAGVLFALYGVAKFVNCEFRNNSQEYLGMTLGGAGLSASFSWITLEQCAFTGNTTSGRGGGLLLYSTSFTMTECLFENNSAGGYGGAFSCGAMDSESTGTVSDCVIRTNDAFYGGGGAHFRWSSPSFDNCVVTGNTTAHSGGGIWCGGGSAPVIRNALITENTASEAGGIFSSEQDDAVNNPALEHSYVCGNSGEQIVGNWTNSNGNVVGPDCSVLTVNGDGTADFTTIQAAIDMALDGDVIMVAGGTYVENLNTQGKMIEIIGELDSNGFLMVTVDGDGADSVVSCVSGETADTKIANLIITNGSNSAGSGGVYIWQASPAFENCVMESNQSYFGGGISCNDSESVFNRCWIRDNTAVAGGGIWCSDASPVFNSCTVVGNSATNGGGGGVMAIMGSAPEITDCLISANTSSVFGGGLYSDSGTMPTVLASTICGNSPDQVSGPWDDAGGNTVSDDCGNMVVIVASDGTGDFTSIQAAINFVGQGSSIEVRAGTYNEHLDTQGKAIEIVGDTDSHGHSQVTVDGANTDTVLRCVTGETDATVIRNLIFTHGYSATGSGGVWCWQSSPTLENCTITENTSFVGGGLSCNDSSPKLLWCRITDNQASTDGGGVWCSSGGDVDLDTCLISGNSAGQLGGGLYSVSSMPVITSTLICGNGPDQTSGSWMDEGGNVVVDDCPINTVVVDQAGFGDYTTIQEAIDDVASGSFIFVMSGTYEENLDTLGKALTIEGAEGVDDDPVVVVDGGGNGPVLSCRNGETPDTIIRNLHLTNGYVAFGDYRRSGGISINQASPTIEDCMVTECESYLGGGLYCGLDCASIIEDCMFLNNYASDSGGGVLCGALGYTSGNCDVTLVGCTITSNESQGGGGGLACQGGTTTVANCEISHNVSNSLESGGGFANPFYNVFLNLSDVYVCSNMADGEFNQYWGAYTDGGNNVIEDECDDDDCPGDANGDGLVDIEDLLIVLDEWGGPCDPDCAADFDDTGVVDIEDLLIVLGNWGVCPLP